MNFGAVHVAAITPHREVGYESDLGAALELVDFLGGAGVDGIALLGSTGEFANLTLDDRAQLVRLAVKRSRVPIVAGITHCTLDGTVTLASQAVEAGAAAILVMPPYFFPYAQTEVREFYLRLSDRMAGAIPILLYNIPFFTTEISMETACDLLATGRFAGIKDSSGVFENFTRLRALRESSPFTLLIGNDKIFTRARQFGADGLISGVACAVPELLLALDAAIQGGDAGKSQSLDARLQEFIEWLDRFPAPIGVKEATAARGIKIGPPSVPLSPEKQRDLDDFRAWFQNWLPAVQRECL